METITERCPLKIAVLNVHNIKMIIYNFSKILSFPCTLLVMETFLHILLLLCVFLLTIVWPYWHPYNKILKVSEEEKKLFCILVAVVGVGVSDRKKISRSGGGEKEEVAIFFEKFWGRWPNYEGTVTWNFQSCFLELFPTLPDCFFVSLPVCICIYEFDKAFSFHWN